jgi:hypothetical protein
VRPARNATLDVLFVHCGSGYCVNQGIGCQHCVLGCTRVRGIIMSTYCYVMCGWRERKYAAFKHVSEEVALRVLLCCSQQLSDRLVKQGAGNDG